MSEFHAAMGLCVLDDIDKILRDREELCFSYEKVLGSTFQMPEWNPDATRNFAYFPILFESEDALLEGKAKLERLGIGSRRYFYPSLDTLSYLQPQPKQNISRNVASRVLCLPLPAPGLKINEIGKVFNLVTR
jgi:dTDP-4-amino-4,6-dideoxygalactose transaminase